MQGPDGVTVTLRWVADVHEESVENANTTSPTMEIMSQSNDNGDPEDTVRRVRIRRTSMTDREGTQNRHRRRSSRLQILGKFILSSKTSLYVKKFKDLTERR